MMTDDFLGPLGFRRKAVGIWEKQGPGMGDLNSWGMGMEFILFFKRGARERSDERRNFVLKVPQVRPEKLIHPHEKPAGILHPLLKHSSKRGDWVADPFAGSGSLLRAARQIGRNSIGCEYDKMNYDLAKRALTQGEGGGFDLGD
jgi:DNA modification methylase